MPAQQADSVAPQKKKQNILVKAYLVLYNLASCFGWGYVYFLVIKNYLDKKGPEQVYPVIEKPLQLVQTAAVLETQQSYAVTTLLTAWCITEVIRYSFYAFQIVGMEPFILTYLRYTLFIVLYPLGVGSELALTFFKLDYIKENRPYSINMPNSFNWSFDSYIFTWLIIASYAPGFYTLYTYMFAKRKQIVGGSEKTKKQ